MERLEQHMETEWAPMSVRAAIQSRVDKGNAAKFSKKLGKDSVHPPKTNMRPQNVWFPDVFAFPNGYFRSNVCFRRCSYGRVTWLSKKCFCLTKISISFK